MTRTLNTHRAPARLAAAALVAIAATQVAAASAQAATRNNDTVMHAAILADDSGVSGVVEVSRRRGAARARLHAIITRAEPGAALEIVLSKRTCSSLRTNPRASERVWSGTADENGELTIGFPAPRRMWLPANFNLGFARTVAIGVRAGTDGDVSYPACSRAQRLRALQPGSRPQVLTSTLTGPGEARGMLKMRMSLTGAITVTSRFTGVQDGSYRLLACGIGTPGCPRGENFRLEIGGIDCLMSVCTARTRLDRRAVRAITRREVDFAIAAADPADGAAVLARGRAVKWVEPELDAGKNE